ncbi:MAG: hypothetical protein AAGL17_11210, partial [Cyanobacteria bacterium J06576_12]
GLTATCVSLAVPRISEPGERYRFRHVTPDAADANQGDGSVSAPFTTLGASTADTDNTGLRSVASGDLVYVQVGDSAHRFQD